jgi:hypothetical protein
MNTAKVYYRVSTFREAGLEAKWSKRATGKPYLVAREVGTKTWYIITSNMFARMQTAGVVEGFKELM